MKSLLCAPSPKGELHLLAVAEVAEIRQHVGLDAVEVCEHLRLVAVALFEVAEERLRREEGDLALELLHATSCLLLELVHLADVARRPLLYLGGGLCDRGALSLG